MDRDTTTPNPLYASSPADAVAHAFENDLMTTGVAPATGPFVINLCAGSTPLSSTALRIPGLEKHRVFQLSRIEEGRTRYRVRVGIFDTEANAEAVLATLRDRYPTALVTSATQEDLKYIKGGTAVPPARTAAARTAATAKPAAAPAKSGIVPSAPAAKASATGPRTGATAAAGARGSVAATPRATVPAEPPRVAAKVPANAPIASAAASFKKAIADLNLEDTAARLPAAAAPVRAVKTEKFFSPHKSVVVETALSLAPESAAPVLTVPAAAAPGAAPLHVAARAEIPFLDLTLESDLGVPQPVISNAAPISTGMLPPAGRKLTAEEIWSLPNLDSTQTIRTLTSTELADENQPKWFVVQLAASDQPVNLDAMPHLDIFSAYRLYSVAMMQKGRILHALRLGFFKEEVSAHAVSGYVKTFFNAPEIVRVSNAEQERFATAPAPQLKPPAKVIDMSSRERVQPAAAAVPAVAAAGDRQRSARAQEQPPADKAKAKTANLRAAGAAHAQTLEGKLRAAARDIESSPSGIRRLQNNTGSFLSRLVGKLSK